MLNSSLVCFLLPTTHLLLRCAPSLRQTTLCFCWLARRIRWRVQVRKYWRLLHYQQRSLCRLPSLACASRISNCPDRLLDHVGVWLLPPSLCPLGLLSPLRQLPYRSNQAHPPRCDLGLLHGHQRALLCSLLQAATLALWPQVVEVATDDWLQHELRHLGQICRNLHLCHHRRSRLH